MTDLISRLRNRREMINAGHGNVYDIADEDCEEAASRIETLEAALRMIVLSSKDGASIEIAATALTLEQDR